MPNSAVTGVTNRPPTVVLMCCYGRKAVALTVQVSEGKMKQVTGAAVLLMFAVILMSPAQRGAPMHSAGVCALKA